MRIRISTKLILLLLVASLLPLTFFGLLSLWQVRKATIVSVTEGNVNVSRRAAAEIEQYVKNGLTILESTAENINHADLQDWQKERILKNYINRFDEFNELTVRNPEGKVVATSRLGPEEISPREKEAFQTALGGKPFLSSVFIREDLSPAMTVGFPIKRLTQVSGVLTAELNLLHMWYLVDNIRIGKKGILHVIDPSGLLIATGDGGRKQEVFQKKPFQPADRLPEIFRPEGVVFRNPLGTKVVAVGTRLSEPLGWSVVVEQAANEAYALAARISRLLAAVMGSFLLLALALGYRGGKREVVNPIRELTRATEELARGNLDYRVALATGDEFQQLGEAFNQMAIRLKEMQEKLIREERHAMFGRIASGLAHDLKHPIQAIENVSRLIDTMYDDADFRQTFRKTVEREFSKINLFLLNLHNLTHEIPHHPVPVKVSSLIREALATFEMEAKNQGIGLNLQIGDEKVHIEADPVSLNRALSNLISNGLQSMKTGGNLTLAVAGGNGRVSISVTDTGVGIPEERLSTLFEDFVTTKRRGLGLGLAITKKIVSQHGGRIDVASQVGRGTCFTLHLPQ